MKKGFMFKSNDFTVDSIQQSKPAQQSTEYGVQMAAVLPSATDEIGGTHHAKYFSK